MSDTDGYNGWTNRATWAVALHVNNDQGSCDNMRDVVRDSLSEYSATCTCGADLIFDDGGNGGWVHSVEGDGHWTPACQAPDADELALHVLDRVKGELEPYLDPREYIDTFGNDITLEQWLDGPGSMLTDVGDPSDINWLELARAFVADATDN